VSFLQTAEVREVVLLAIVVARAEEPHAELVVLKQETTKVRRERLNADAQTVEVVAGRHVAQMLVDERGLNTDETVVASSYLRADQHLRLATHRATPD